MGSNMGKLIGRSGPKGTAVNTGWIRRELKDTNMNKNSIVIVKSF